MPISVPVRTSFATANERWNSWCSVVPKVPAVSALARHELQLAEDLRFADHHRREAAREAECVARGEVARVAARLPT